MNHNTLLYSTKFAGEPFAGFKDMAACIRWVKKNRPEVRNPAAYCATIMRKVEGTEEIAERPLSVGTLQKHKVGEQVHADLKLRWYNKNFSKLTDYARTFTLTKVPADLPQIKLEEEILASQEACPKVYSWKKINGFPTLFMWKTKESMPFKEFYHNQKGFLQLPVKFRTVIGWNIPYSEVVKFTQEIQPLEWLDIEGEISVERPSFLEPIEKHFKYILGTYEPSLIEIFCFGEKLDGRYVFRKEPDKKFVFWKPTDQSRFEELKKLLGNQTGASPTSPERLGEQYSWDMPIKNLEEYNVTGETSLQKWEHNWTLPIQEIMNYPENQKKGVLIGGEAIHSGRLRSRKEYVNQEVLKAGRVLKKKPIRWSPHHTGQVIGQVWDSEPFQSNGDVVVEYLGYVWSPDAIKQLKQHKEGHVSVGVEFRKPEYWNGLKPTGVFFEDLVLLKPHELAGDEKATYQVWKEMFEVA